MTTPEISPIIAALKSDDHDLRLSNGSRWLIWYDGQWEVWKKPRHMKGLRLVLKTDDEGAAVIALVGDESETA